MNKSKLIWGIICLIIAGGLAIANLRLPPEAIMFQIGDVNMPWVPVVALAIVGIILLATAGNGGKSLPKKKRQRLLKTLRKQPSTNAWKPWRGDFS